VSFSRKTIITEATVVVKDLVLDLVALKKNVVGGMLIMNSTRIIKKMVIKTG